MFGGIRLQQAVQVLPRPTVAAVHPHDGHGLPRIVLPALHLLQHHIGVLPFHCQCPLLGFGHSRRHVVLRFHPPRLFGGVLWLQEGEHFVSHRHVHDCPCGSRTFLLHDALGRDQFGGDGPLRGRVRRAFLHHDVVVDGSVLLRLWVHPRGVLYPPHYLCGSDRPPLLLPAMCRKSQVVVVLLLRIGEHCRVYICLQFLLVP
mmetsp:Transcript_11829/g.21859  ORF Transcript_11829/g.21859 Transcript_11829/m.21859 type:complete len:202 (+) Transcript_11829:1345-1950(+)